MQATRSKIFTTGLIAAMAMLALVASLFAVKPAFADDLTAGLMFGEQSYKPSIKVNPSTKVTVGKTITIKATNEAEDEKGKKIKQTGTWVWTATKGSSLVQLLNTDKATVQVKGLKGGQVTLNVKFITKSGKQSSQRVTVNVYGIKSTKVSNGIVYKRTGVDTVAVQKTQNNKDISKTSISIPKTIKLGDSEFKVTYKVTAINAYALNVQKKKTKKITVGDNVASIGKSAFADNQKMKTLVLGKGVKTMGVSMVSNCKSLKTITINSTKLTKKGVKNCFKGAKVLKTVKVPKSKVKSYKSIFTKRNCGATVKVVAK